ncbi:MAG: archease [archaeon]|nr:archease [archaeon]
MKAHYTFIDHTADVLFEAEAPTLEGLFEQCALALEETQVDISSIKGNQEITITGKNKTIDKLLFDFLDDLVFHKDADLLIFNKFKIKITEITDGYELECKAKGDILDHKKHGPKVDVKAITMHMFEVKKIRGGWRAKVLIDI